MSKTSIFFIITFSLVGWTVLAQDPFSILDYPIPELGNCQSREACEAYCDLPENMGACLDFAEVHDLISREEINMARKILALGETSGPGGCRGQAECEAYCDDVNHIEECIIFGEEHGLIPPEELEEAKKVVAAIKKGIKPPNCTSKTECDIYCSQPEHMEECITFGEAAGLIPPEELQEAKQVLEAIKKGATPPPCRGKEECDIYCEQPEHLEECISFAEAAGFISPDEAAMVRKTGGKGPGGCRGEEECEAYCEDPTHMEECIRFALEYGFMSAEEAEQAKKMLELGLTGGPGGCKSEEECEAYCNELSHMEECMDFAEKMGFVTPEEAERARKMAEMGVTGGPGGCQGEEECRAFCEDPANMEECLNFAVKIGEMTPEEAEMAHRGGEMMQMGGPGGCQSEAECEAYCEDPTHAEECIKFSIEQGFMSPEEGQRMLEMMKRPPEEMMGAPSEMMEPKPEGMQPSPEMMEMEKPPEMMGPPPEGEKPPEEMMAPSEEMMMPEKEGPSPTEQEAPPQSFLDETLQILGLQDLEEQVKQFLAGVGVIFEF